MNSSFENILVLSPHPDDSEYSCYGMIKKMNSNATILICSSGGSGDESNKSDRVLEVYNFWSRDGANVKIVQFDLLGVEYHDSVKYLDSFILKNKFDAIFIPPEKDTNQEHRKISNIAKSSLRNKGGAVFEYWTPSTTHGWQPNIWIDVSDYIERKIELLSESFKSQLHKSYFDKNYIELFHNDWQAFKKNIEKCEKFRLTSWMLK